MKTHRNITKPMMLMIALAFGSATLAACDQEGPLEQAGEKADEAINDAKRAVKDAAD